MLRLASAMTAFALMAVALSGCIIEDRPQPVRYYRPAPPPPVYRPAPYPPPGYGRPPGGYGQEH